MEHYIDPDQALERVLSEVARAEPLPIPPERALGLVLAEDVRADRSYPPFDRAMMDGYAVRTADAGRAVTVSGTVAAGHESRLEVSDVSVVPPPTLVVITTGDELTAPDEVGGRPRSATPTGRCSLPWRAAAASQHRCTTTPWTRIRVSTKPSGERPMQTSFS